MNEVVIELPGRPKTLNHISSAGHWEKSAEIKLWRTLAKSKAKRFDPFTSPVDIEITHLCTPRKMPDHISPAFAIKGAEDGFVDAGLMKNDDKRYVRRLILNAPIKASNDGLLFTIRDAAEKKDGPTVHADPYPQEEVQCENKVCSEVFTNEEWNRRHQFRGLNFHRRCCPDENCNTPTAS